MQNAQNTDIQQRVINLVELYRTKVGKESQIAKDAKANFEDWENTSVDMLIEEGIGVGYGIGPQAEVWKNHLMVNEQLLGHFYAEVAGKNAEQGVLSQLLPDVYDKTIFTEEEENYLKTHFKEMVNYIIQTPCDNSVKWVNSHDSKDVFTIPSEVLELISSRIEIASGSKVFYPNTFFAQLANLFDGSTFYVDTMLYAWTRIAVYANSIDAKELDDNTVPHSYDAIVSYLPTISDSEDSKTIKHLCDAYNNLPSGGIFILLCPSGLLAEDTDSSHRNKLTEAVKSFVKRRQYSDMDDICSSFRRMLVEGRSIKEIIQLPRVMSKNASSDTYCLLIAEKDRTDSDVILIDARTARNDIGTEQHKLSFDMAKFDAIMKNDGKDPNTGLRKVVRVSTEVLSQHLLIPEVYTIERPSGTEHPVPLSSLCSLESTLVRDVPFDLPEDTPWITIGDLTPLFTGDMKMSNIRKADCPNNPPFVENSEDYAFGKDGKFVDSIWEQMDTRKGSHVLEYRQSTFLDEKSDAVLYEHSAEHGVHVAVVRATGKPYVLSKGILVFCPINGYDVNSLAALLRLPIVFRQLWAYQKYGIEYHLDNILVPTDKRIIGDELYRMKKEESVTNELGEKVQTMKAEYINEVRMRKHDMRPHLRQLASSERLMKYYIDNTIDLEELKKNLRNQIGYVHNALYGLSAIVDHLSDEEKFGHPEILNVDKILSDIEINHNDSEGFVIEYDCDKEAFRKNGFALPDICKEWELAKEQGFDMVKFIQEKSRDYLPLLIKIAPVDFQRLIDNIIENARKHGFTDKTRTDYYIGIDLSIDSKRDMYQIDFNNNGNPLPEGMNKHRYGIKGEKAGLTGGTGSGGYIVKSIVNHYGGDYDVFSKNGITTVRIFLPIQKYENNVRGHLDR